RNIPATRAIIAHNGVNLQKFQKSSPQSRQNTRNDWGIKSDEFVAIFISHNLRLKNLPFLIKVFDYLHSKKHQLKLVVCGKHRPIYKRKYLIYAGVTSQLENFYSAADILLHPTFYDAFGNILPEAIACGLPAIVSDATGAAELISPNEKAYHVLPVSMMWQKNGIQQWADTILQIKNQYPLLQNEIAQKRLFLEKNLSLEHFIDQFEELLK
ncbi:MAG: glycosyltransferase family 4 protein, partial [Lentisphaeria bacterium]